MEIVYHNVNFEDKALAKRLKDFELVLPTLEELSKRYDAYRPSVSSLEELHFGTYYDGCKLYIGGKNKGRDIYRFCNHCNKWMLFMQSLFQLPLSKTSSCPEELSGEAYLWIHCCFCEVEKERIMVREYGTHDNFFKDSSEKEKTHMLEFHKKDYFYLQRKPVLLLRELTKSHVGEAFAVWNIMKNTALYLT